MVDDQSRIDQLWMRYQQRPERAIRDELILHYSPLVKYVAGRVGAGLPQNVDQGDLASYGMFGLIDAIDKFDPERGFKFETYAMSRIKGAILDELRSMDWVPRSVRAKARAIERAFAKLEADLHRAPTDDELAAELEISLNELLDQVNRISLAGVIALDEMLSGDRGESITLGDTLPTPEAGPVGAFEVEETRQVLAETINGMPEREKLVLTLYYYENLTLAEIGRALDVTESRVCQIHTKAVLHLKSRMAAVERETV
jgi:RNA polymerase sigma factor for flagellar operon FliA